MANDDGATDITDAILKAMGGKEPKPDAKADRAKD